MKTGFFVFLIDKNGAFFYIDGIDGDDAFGRYAFQTKKGDVLFDPLRLYMGNFYYVDID